MQNSMPFSFVGHDNFDLEVQKEKRTVVLACIHRSVCMIEQIAMLENVIKKFDKKLKVCLVNVDQLKPFMKRLKIEGTPTYLIYKDGREKDRIMGAVDAQALVLTILNCESN